MRASKIEQRILVTGGCGFIGSNFIRHVLTCHPQCQVVNLDALTYAGNLENLSAIADSAKYTFCRGDITSAQDVAKSMEGVDCVVHFAAESHVDRSILDATPFIQTNVTGTYLLLEEARRQKVRLFVHISTDEVYGSADNEGEFFSENAPLRPSSPYSASKAAADLLALSYHKTHGLPVVIIRSTNNYGPYQFPEKAIPLFLTNALEDIPLPLYGDGSQIRDWIYVEDNCRAIASVVESGCPGQIYNVGTGVDTTNLTLVKKLLAVIGKPESLIQPVSDRPGHDRRYAVDTEKTCYELGWQPQIPLEKGLQRTVDWYLQNRSWWRKIKSGEYRSYYQKLYQERQ